jgi:hypothetical protein
MFPKNTQTVDQYETAIRERWQDSLCGILEICRLLKEAKGSNGEPGTLSKEEFKDLVYVRLEFSDVTVRRLIRIANDDRINSRSHVTRLPSYWGTLAALTSLTDEEFQAGIGSGEIHPNMERKDVKNLKPQKPKKVVEVIKAKPLRDTGMPKTAQVEAQVSALLSAVLPEIKPEEGPEFFEMLRQIIDEAEQKANRLHAQLQTEAA